MNMKAAFPSGMNVGVWKCDLMKISRATSFVNAMRSTAEFYVIAGTWGALSQEVQSEATVSVFPTSTCASLSACVQEVF